MRWRIEGLLGLIFAASCGAPQMASDEEMTAHQHEQEAMVAVADADSAAELAHAREHRQRAEALRAFEDEACHGLDDAERASCPLLLHLDSAVSVEDGVELVFERDTDLGPVYRELRCHLAFARRRAARASITARSTCPAPRCAPTRTGCC